MHPAAPLFLYAVRDKLPNRAQPKHIATKNKWHERSRAIQLQEMNFYCVVVFTMSPTRIPDPDTILASEETASASVIWITPTGAVNLRITWPETGSLISLVTRSTLIWS